MPKLPVVSGIQLVKTMCKLGYQLDHQTGSHIFLRNNCPPCRRLAVLNHREISKGTLRAVIRESGISLDQFKRILNKH